MGALWADWKSRKSSFWSVFSYSMQQQRTISQSDCDMWWKVDFISQPGTASSVVGPRSSKALPKAKIAPKKGHSHCLVVCCLSDPLQLSESWRNHYIWEVCSANRWCALKTATPAAGIGQQKRAQFCSKTTPNHNQYNQRFKSWTNWATKFCPICHIHLTSFNGLPLLQASRQLFEGTMLPQPAAGRKCFPRVCRIPNHRFLRSRNEHACFLLAKMCWLYNQNMCWFLFWWIKMLFEPCYNDWKSTVQNRSPSKKLCLPQPNNIEPLCAHGTNIVLEMNFNLKGKRMLGLPWWPSAQDSMLPLQGAGVHTW